eukprot:856092-Amphidinium_carterae.1
MGDTLCWTYPSAVIEEATGCLNAKPRGVVLSLKRIFEAKRAAELKEEQDFDKEFVAGVLERERKVAEQEENEKRKVP